MWVVPVVPVPQWDVSPLNLLEKKELFHRNFTRIFGISFFSSLLRALLFNNCTSKMISPMLGVEVPFLQLSRCALNGIPLPPLGMEEKAGNKQWAL